MHRQLRRPRARALPAPRIIAQFVPLPVIVLSGAAMLLLTACGGSAAQAAPATEAAVPVRVTALATPARAEGSAINVTGTLAGKEEVALAFKIGGVVSRVLVNPGEAVRSGQVLAELSPTEIAAQVANARESLGKAERDLARVSRLYADSVTTLEQLQDARTGVAVATNTLRIAQFNAGYSVVRAPGDGVVLTRAAEPGQVVEPGRPVLTVRRNGRGMVVRFGLPDNDAVRVRIGDAATVQFEAMGDRVFNARVTQRAAAATPGTGDYGVEVTLAEAANNLPTGLVARVQLRASAAAASTTARIFVPLDALVDADADSAAVFVLRADRQSVTRRPVKLTDVAEALSTAMVPVVSGLDGSETVVIAGMSRLVDGTKVTVVAPATRRTTGADAPVTKDAAP
jgi:membrane fusion protein, multidrug efflux system